METPNEARLGLLKLEVAKFDTVAAFARAYLLDETYIRQLLKGHRAFGERAARKMGEEKFGSPDYFTPSPGIKKEPQRIDRAMPRLKRLYDIAENINDAGLKKLIAYAEDISRLYPATSKQPAQREKAA
jgi:hypothetical protein